MLRGRNQAERLPCLDLEYARHTFQKGQSLGLLITTIAHTMASRLEPGNTK